MYRTHVFLFLNVLNFNGCCQTLGKWLLLNLYPQKTIQWTLITTLQVCDACGTSFKAKCSLVRHQRSAHSDTTQLVKNVRESLRTRKKKEYKNVRIKKENELIKTENVREYVHTEKEDQKTVLIEKGEECGSKGNKKQNVPYNWVSPFAYLIYNGFIISLRIERGFLQICGFCGEQMDSRSHLIRHVKVDHVSINSESTSWKSAISS